MVIRLSFFACRLGGVDKFLRYSGMSWDDRVQTYCQGTVLGGLTMDLWSLSHYVLLPVSVLFIPLGVRVNASLPLFSVVKPFPFRSFGFSLNFLDRLGLREELLTKLAESTVIPYGVRHFFARSGREGKVDSHSCCTPAKDMMNPLLRNRCEVAIASKSRSSQASSVSGVPWTN